MSEQTAEERARAQGWRDKDEFSGNPDDWRPAEEFLERGEKILPILQERFGKMEAENTKLAERLEAVTGKLGKFAEFHKGTYKRAYDNAKREIENRLRVAEQEQDFAGYKQASDDLAQVEQDIQQFDVQEGDDTPQPVPEFFDFKKANTWYDSDIPMTVYANYIADQLVGVEGINSNVEYYARIEQEVKRQFPHKFTGGGQPPVEDGAGDGSGERKQKKSWNDLPKEAKDAYNVNFSDIPNFSKADYAKDYFAQEEGVPAWNR
jgi:hypothetical protein